MASSKTAVMVLRVRLASAFRRATKSVGSRKFLRTRFVVMPIQ